MRSACAWLLCLCLGPLVWAQAAVAQQSAAQQPVAQQPVAQQPVAQQPPPAAQTPRQIAPRSVQQPVKSPNDQRDYRALTLANGLKLLLISDPATEQSAAALRVEVGNAQDPADRAGLAHFLEHMLFLGTEKYPEAGAYQSFISKHGGSHNAYTALDHTLYYFDIQPDALAPALDRFAQFFVAPLFSPDYVQREREAVQAEYTAKIKDDGRRANSVLAELYNPAHPASQFSVGNLDTLADRPGAPVREALLAFYQQHYGADNMSLVVFGREPLDSLQQLATDLFAAVPAGAPLPPPEPVPLFAPGSLPLQVHYRPEKELRELRLVFALPDLRAHYGSKPLIQICNLLGHEGPGSLMSALKAEGLAEALWAGDGGMGPYGTNLMISVNLTQKGLQQQAEVLSWVFAAIDQVVQQGLQEWRFDELKKLADISFRFQEKRSPASLVQALAGNLRLYPAEDLLQVGYLYDNFDLPLLQSVAAQLHWQNALVLVADKDVEADRASAYYQTPYRVSALSAPAPLAPAQRARLQLPKPNPFVPQRLQLRDNPEPRAEPERILAEPGLRLWHQQDNQFNSPRSVIRIALRSPRVAQDVASRAQAELYVAMVLDELNEYSYPALLAGLGFDIQVTARGLDITLAGYNDRQGLLLTEILEALVSPRLEPARFANIRAELIRRTRNTTQQQPYVQLLQQLAPVLYSPAWSSEKLAEAMANTGLQELKAFGRQFGQGAQVDMLVYGNMLMPEARQLASLVGRQLVQGGPAAVDGRLKLLTPRTGGYQYRLKTPHPDHGLVMYHQAPADDLAARAHMVLLVQSIRAPFFHQLRTQQQLGYVVFATDMNLADYPGLVLVAQSPQANPRKLRAAFEQFIGTLSGWLADDLEIQRAAVLQELNRKPRNLSEQAGRYWEAIAQAGPGGKVDFNYRSALAAALSDVNAVTLRTFAYQVLDPERRLLLATGPAAGKGLPVTDLTKKPDFKQKGPHHRLP